MTHRELSELFDKLVKDQCSEEEADLILELLADESNAGLFRSLITQQLQQPGADQTGDLANPSLNKTLALKLEHILQTPAPKEPVFRRLVRTIRPRYAAAAVLLLLSAGLYLLTEIKAPVPPAPIPPVTQPIAAGSDKAILTLSDGRQINLDKIANGDIATQSNAVVKKTANGVLVYDMATKTNAPGLPAALPGFNTITTPRGGQYQVVLPDGSKVWLNAASSLKFPTQFDPQQRQVELTGEGYFEIATITHQPFVVTSNGQKIEVLGTMFNVNAYKEEAFVKTTLLNGKIRVNALSGEQQIPSRTLLPGQQSELSGSDLKISEGNTEAALAWKNGKFQFEHEDIQVVMRKIARWYNVEVEYHGNMKGKIFSGIIPRYEDVQEVLKMLQLTGNASFTLKDRTVEVS